MDKLLRWGDRVFPSSRVAFSPILMLFLWGAAVRIVVSDRVPPISFSAWPGRWAEPIWEGLMLGCPPLFVLAWWLIARSGRLTLAGMWLRLAADLGILTALVTWHVATVAGRIPTHTESRIVSRYIVGATLVFVVALVIRDIWDLVKVERLAYDIRANG